MGLVHAISCLEIEKAATPIKERVAARKIHTPAFERGMASRTREHFRCKPTTHHVPKAGDGSFAALASKCLICRRAASQPPHPLCSNQDIRSHNNRNSSLLLHQIYRARDLLYPG